MTLESEILSLQKAAQDRLSLGRILSLFARRGRPLIIFLLSLPFCLPIQIPGLSTLFGCLIAFMGLRIVFGKKVWLPERLLKKKVPQETLARLVKRALTLVRKMKPWVHPRLISLSCHPFMEKSNGWVFVFLGLFLALPLPIPFSNLLAAWSIFFVALGMLEDDGLLIAIGYLLSCFTLCLLMLIVMVAINLSSAL